MSTPAPVPNVGIFGEILSKLGQLFNWIYTIQPWEQALRVRAGKHVKKIPPGIHLRIPFVDAVFMQSVRFRACSIDSQTLTTRDSSTITLAGSMRYRIDAIEKMYLMVYNVADTVKQEIQGAVTQYVITHDACDCTPEKMHAYVSSTLDFSKYGFADVEFFLTNFAKVKTYRLINGNLEQYYSDYVDMSTRVGGPSR